MIYENKNCRLRAFLMPFIAIPVVVSIITLTRILPKGITDNMFFVYVLVVGISVIVGAGVGISSAVKMPKMKITISDKEIDVVKGTAHGVYALEDFIECKKQTISNGRKIKFLMSLVFKGEDDILFIDCEGYSYYVFLHMADELTIRKKALLIDDRTDDKVFLTDDCYSGSFNYSDKGPSKYFFVVAFILMIVIAGASFFFVLDSGFTPLTINLAISSLLGFVYLIGFIIFIKVGQKTLQKGVAEKITLDSFDLRINSLSWSYSDIQKMYITPPYLPALDEETDTRNIEFVISGSGKPIKYVIEKRPKQYDSNDEYTKLYNSIVKLCEQKGIVVEQLPIFKRKCEN